MNIKFRGRSLTKASSGQLPAAFFCVSLRSLSHKSNQRLSAADADVRQISMNENTFWKVIGTLDWSKEEDDDRTRPVVNELVKLAVPEIESFEEILSRKLYDIDTMEHARNIGEDSYVNDEQHFSVDWFLYARCCVVANGKEFYEDVLKNPPEFPKDIEFEALLSIAQIAFEEKTDSELDCFNTTVSYETYSNKDGWNA